ncbi:Ger(x)C family spore germination protein [Paenibacillus sp. y28]|uniref:Ger(x)C family spore germination protein n=1 Tax=Paenibacillus sp. y28 TaxID=3129110 RepID=UPI0030177E2F
MRRRMRLGSIVLMLMLCMCGCYDRLDMEDATFPLLTSLDLDENNKLKVYNVYPLFVKGAKKKSRELDAGGLSLRQNRERLDAYSPGAFQGRKIQVLLISKRVLQYEDWFPILDVFFRDARNPLTPRMVVYDGPLSEIVYSNPRDEPMLPILLKGMVDTKSARSETVSTTLQELHWQMYEKGITPSMAQVKVDKKKEITLDGAALLDRRGKFKTELDAQETVFLNVLQKNAPHAISLSFPIPGQGEADLPTNMVSLTVEKPKARIKVSYADNRFQFNIQLKLAAGLSEIVFPFNLREEEKQLEQMISEQATRQLDSLIKKFQQYRIDPAGLGRYARAHEYQAFKQVENDWGAALAKAKVQVDVKVDIKSTGPVRGVQ